MKGSSWLLFAVALILTVVLIFGGLAGILFGVAGVIFFGSGALLPYSLAGLLALGGGLLFAVKILRPAWRIATED